MDISNPSQDMYRGALKWALDCNNVLLQSAQRLRHHQIKQIDAALSDCNHVSKQLEAAPDQAQLLALGSKLASDQLQRVWAYWSGMGNTLAQSQIELAGTFQSQTLVIVEGIKQRLEAAPAAIPIPEPIAATIKLAAEVVRAALAIPAQQMKNSFDTSQAPGKTNGGQRQTSQRKQQDAEARA